MGAYTHLFDQVDETQLRNRRSVKWSKFPDDVLACWVADMDFGIAPPIVHALRRQLDLHDLGYPSPEMRDEVRQLFAERMHALYSWAIDPQDTWLLTTVVQGLHVGIGLFTQPGDGVVVQTPIYPPFLQAIDLLGRRMIDAPLGRDGDKYVVDVEALEANIDADTTMLMLCNPHNPTGRCFSVDELTAVAEVAEKHDLTVIADEIHQDLRYDDAQHHVFAVACPEVAHRTITLTSASKSFNLAGNRCAIVHFGSAALRDAFHARTTRVYGEVSLAGHAATIAAWSDPESQLWFDDLLEYLDTNRRWLFQAVTEQLPQARMAMPEGTYLSWLDLSSYQLGESPADYLVEHGRVALGNGTDFGAHGHGHVRVNLATSRAMLERVVDRVKTTIEVR